MTVCIFIDITSYYMSDFQTFFFKFSGRLASSVGGVGVHKGTASYPISRDNEARVNDVRLYLKCATTLFVAGVILTYICYLKAETY